MSTIEISPALPFLLPVPQPAFELGGEIVTPVGIVTDQLIYATIDKQGEQSARWVQFRTGMRGEITRTYL